MTFLLQGIKVLDLTRLTPGEFCTLILADLGAEVIKVEEPTRGDYIREFPPLINGVSIWHIMLNRNKKSITLNLKDEREREIFLELSKTADVIVESFRPGVVKRLGIDYETIKDVNPRIIYCSISGYGQDTSYASRAGHDLNYISQAGILSLSPKTREDVPAIPPILIADLTGGVMAAVGILAALIQREKTGRGVYLDISMVDTSLFWNITNIAVGIALDRQPTEEDIRVLGGFGCYNVFKTKDNRYITFGALEEKFWGNLCRALGLEDLIPKQYSREDRVDVIKKLRDVLGQKKLDELMEILNKVDTCVAPVLTVPEVLNSKYVKERKIIAEYTHPKIGKIKMLLLPIKINGEFPKVYLHAPDLGENNREYLMISKSDNSES